MVLAPLRERVLHHKPPAPAYSLSLRVIQALGGLSPVGAAREYTGSITIRIDPHAGLVSAGSVPIPLVDSCQPNWDTSSGVGPAGGGSEVISRSRTNDGQRGGAAGSRCSGGRSRRG